MNPRYLYRIFSSCLLALLTLVSDVSAEPSTDIVIWQKEKRWVVAHSGTRVPLQRGPFFLVLPISAGGSLQLALGPTPVPADFQALAGARGMAGPYGTSLILDWDAHHYFDYRPAESAPPRTRLWDRGNAQVYFQVRQLERRDADGELETQPFATCPDLDLVVRREGFEDLLWQIHWLP